MKKSTKKEFTEKSNVIHKNKYDYSLVEYITAHTKVKIICPIHGVFEQSPSKHLFGRGCPKCKFIKLSNIYKSNTKEFTEKSNVIHNNKYDYSLVEYINSWTKVKIICPIHGVFEQTPDMHLHRQGCPICGGTKKLTNKEFIDKSNDIHNNKYDYSLVEYINSDIKVKIICPIHGVFEQIPYIHIMGCGCPICNESKGEKKINDILVKNNINFIREKRFKDCKYKLPLPFDFYLLNNNICIEYDGLQHFIPRNVFGGDEEYQKTIIKDNIKNIYCKQNNIYLLRITYKDNIVQKMDELLKKLINENMIKSWKEFNKLNEDEGGSSGTAVSTNSNTGGMGNVVSAQPSSIPGDVAGSTIGSGDISNPTLGPYTKTPQKFKNKISKKKDKKDRKYNHKGENIDQFYVTKYTEKYSDGNIVQNWKAKGNT